MWAWLKDFFTVKEFFTQTVMALASALLNVVAQGGMPKDSDGWVLVIASAAVGWSSKSKKAVKADARKP